MRTGLMSTLFAAAFFLQGTIVKAFFPAAFGPDLLLCSAVLAVFVYENTQMAVTLGVFAALARDLCFSLYAPAGAAALFFSCLAAILAGRVFTWESPAFLFLFTALVTLLHNLLLFAGEKLMGSPYGFFYVLKLQPGYILCNTALMAGLYLIFIRNRKAGS